MVRETRKQRAERRLKRQRQQLLDDDPVLNGLSPLYAGGSNPFLHAEVIQSSNLTDLVSLDFKITRPSSGGFKSPLSL